MRVLMIWPYHGEERIEYIPLALAYLKANTDQAVHPIAILDTVLEDLPPGSDAFVRALEGHQFDLVGISCTSNKFAHSMAYAEQVKARFPDVPIVVGGVHVTSYPDETIRFPCFDYAFTGEAEFSFPKFLDALESGSDLAAVPGLVYRTPDGEIRKNPVEKPPDLDAIVPPNYADIGLTRYYEKGYQFIHDKMDHAPVWISRGCPYACRFCASPELNGKAMRYHSVGYVEAYVRRLHADFGVRHVNIIDDNFTFDMDKAKVILRMLIGLKRELGGMSFAFPNGIRMQRVDEELLRLMVDAGFKYVVFAPESGSLTMLKLMRKGLVPEVILEKFALAKSVGLKVMSFWIVGYPGETPETMEETRQMIMKARPDMVSLHAFAALPGTPIFNQLVEEGKIAKSYLPHSYQRIVAEDYLTEGITREQLAKFVRKVYFQHYMMKPWNAWTQLRITGFRSLGGRILDLLYRNQQRAFAARQKEARGAG